MRNKQLLTDRENERMFGDIVENIVKKPIHIRYTSKPISSVESFGRYHVITLGRTKGVDKFTLLNHEAGHILFNSPTKSGEYMINCWADEWKADPFIHLDTLKEIYWSILNLIEDQRIESLMAKLYLYNKKRFYRAKVHVGREYKCIAYTPFLILGYTRFLRDDLIEKDKCSAMARKILNEVEGTGQRGALIGLAKFKPFIDKYISGNIEHSSGRSTQEWSEEVKQTQLGYEERGMVSINDIEDRN